MTRFSTAKSNNERLSFLSIARTFSRDGVSSIHPESFDRILLDLIAAFWRGDFEGLVSRRSDNKDGIVSRNSLWQVLTKCGPRMPPEVSYPRPGRDPPWEILAELTLDQYDLTWRQDFIENLLISKGDLLEWSKRRRHWLARRIKRATPGDREAAAAAWLCQMTLAGPKQKSKEGYWEEAKTKFPGLTRRAFERVWASFVPPEWKKSGRPPKSAQ